MPAIVPLVKFLWTLRHPRVRVWLGFCELPCSITRMNVCFFYLFFAFNYLLLHLITSFLCYRKTALLSANQIAEMPFSQSIPGRSSADQKASGIWGPEHVQGYHALAKIVAAMETICDELGEFLTIIERG